MGDSDISTALAKRIASNALMAPPPRPKRVRRPQKVLDEDTYTTALEYIIARDFYPGLLETKTLSDYLDALESGDEVYIAEKERLARTVMNTPRAAMGTPRRAAGDMTPLNISSHTPRTVRGGDTPATGATPDRAEQQHEERALKDQAGNKVDLNLNLSDFQARYTSEDNESFYKIVDRQNLKKAAERAWYFTGNKLPSKRQIAQAAVHEQRRIAAGGDSQALIKAPQPSENPDDRPANIDARPQHSNQGPKNSLMFMADDITDTHPGLTSVAEKRQQRSNAPPKSVNYGSTRLAQASVDNNGDTDDAASTVPQSPSLSAIDAAIRGKPVPRRASTIASSSIANDEDDDIEAGQSGYAYVDADPTPSEVAAFSNGPPKLLPPSRPQKSFLEEMVEANAGTTGASAFSISSPSKREALRDKLVEKQLATRRTPATHLRSSDRLGALRGETPRFLSSPRPGGGATPSRNKSGAELTPAAQKLYDTLGGRTPGSNNLQRGASGKSAFDDTGKGPWTPTPLRVKKTGK